MKKYVKKFKINNTLIFRYDEIEKVSIGKYKRLFIEELETGDKVVVTKGKYAGKKGIIKSVSDTGYGITFDGQKDSTSIGKGSVEDEKTANKKQKAKDAASKLTKSADKQLGKAIAKDEKEKEKSDKVKRDKERKASKDGSLVGNVFELLGLGELGQAITNPGEYFGWDAIDDEYEQAEEEEAYQREIENEREEMAKLARDAASLQKRIEKDPENEILQKKAKELADKMSDTSEDMKNKIDLAKKKVKQVKDKSSDRKKDAKAKDKSRKGVAKAVNKAGKNASKTTKK